MVRMSHYLLRSGLAVLRPVDVCDFITTHGVSKERCGMRMQRALICKGKSDHTLRSKNPVGIPGFNWNWLGVLDGNSAGHCIADRYLKREKAGPILNTDPMICLFTVSGMPREIKGTSLNHQN